MSVEAAHAFISRWSQASPSEHAALTLAQQIRDRVTAILIEHGGSSLPRVTATIGVATSPPESRSADLESLAESRNRQGKAAGKNRVISE